MTSYDILKICFIVLFVIAIFLGIMKINETYQLNINFIPEFKMVYFE